MPSTLTSLKCHINQKWIKGANIQKIIWPGTKSKWGKKAPKVWKKTRQFLLLSHLAATGIVLKIAKRKLAAPQKSRTKQRADRRECEPWVRWVPISHADNIRRRVPAALAKMATAGRICNASSIWDGREWPVRKAAPGRSRSSNISSSDPSLHQKMSPRPVLYGPILGA